MNDIFLGKSYAFLLRDINNEQNVKNILLNTYARMRRPAPGETNAIKLPAVYIDMFRITSSLANKISNEAIDLPYLDNSVNINNSLGLGLTSTNTWNSQGFDSLKIQKTAFPYIALLMPQQSAFKNNFSINFKPIIDNTTTSVYQIFNHIIHKAMIQPGIILQPYTFINDQMDLNRLFDIYSSVYRAYGPLLVSNATVQLNNGDISMTVGFVGSNCFIGLLTPNGVNDYPIPPARESDIIDTRILIGLDAEPYFTSDDLFLGNQFENDVADVIYNYQQLNNPIKRIINFTLNISNTYSTTYSLPGDLTKYTNYNEKFISNDDCGARFFTLTDRSVNGSITFIYDKINELELDYLTDNSVAHKLIFSLTPNYHFPLTDVQFNIGDRQYQPDKTVKVTYKFIARLSLKANLSMISSANVNGPTSEFGYQYNILTNDFVPV